MWTFALVPLLLLSASASEGHGSANALASSKVSCGGITDVATVERYFADLRLALAQAGPKRPFNKLVADEFGVRSKRGYYTLYSNTRDVVSVTPSRITLQEWREISRRGSRSLQNAGWRGCFLDNGKVWFVGSKKVGFRLTLISKDMPWVAPVEGDLLPIR